LAVADPSGADWGDRSHETYETNFIHHSVAQFGKQHSRHNASLSSVVLSQQCYEIHFTFHTV